MQREQILEKIKRMCLMDDAFFNVCMDGSPECVELILRIIMDEPTLQVQNGFDVMATANGKVYDIEVQRADEGAIPQRARYNAYMIGANELRSGKAYNELPESCVIFITARDVIGDSLPIYHIDRIIRETGKPFADGDHIIYVNGENRDDTPLGRLMQDFFCAVPNEMNYPVLARRARYFKEDEGGVAKMSPITQEIFDEGEMKGKIEMVVKMLRAKQTLEFISQISEFTIERIKEIAAQNDIAIVE